MLGGDQTYSIIDIGATTYHDPVVYNENLPMNIELFLDIVLLLLFWLAFPRLLGDFASVQHGILGDGIGTVALSVRSSIFPLRLKLSLLIDHFLLRFVTTVVSLAVATATVIFVTVYALAHDLFCLSALEVLVLYP